MRRCRNPVRTRTCYCTVLGPQAGLTSAAAGRQDAVVNLVAGRGDREDVQDYYDYQYEDGVEPIH